MLIYYKLLIIMMWPLMFIVKLKLILDYTLKLIKLICIQTTDVHVALPILQAGIYRLFLVNAVDINGKFKINATSSDILKIQRVGGILVYDALELSFYMADKTSIFKINNLDSLESLNLKATASNVYTKQ